MTAVPMRDELDQDAAQRAARTLPLSVAIVCCDNARTIGRTLASAAPLAREIVAVDSGSTDGTTELLEEAGARVIRSKWLGHVRTKQLALEACSEPWILCLDSDESLEPDLQRSIAQALSADPPSSLAGYRLNRVVWWRGRFLRHAWQPEWRLRLVRRGACAWGGFDPHDQLLVKPGQPAQRVANLTGTLRHDSIGSMPAFFMSQARHAQTAARSLAARGARGSIASLVFSPTFAWLKQMALRQAWRDGWRGWCAASATAAAALMKHAALLEMTRAAPDSGEDAEAASGAGASTP